MQHQRSNFIITSECVFRGFDIDKSGSLAHTPFRETLVDNLVVFVGVVTGGFLMGRRKDGAIKQRKKTLETFRVTHASHILKFEIIDHMKVILYLHTFPQTT